MCVCTALPEGQKEIFVLPTDAAFSDFFNANELTADQALADPDLLANILTVHLGVAANNGASIAETISGNKMRLLTYSDTKVSFISVPDGTAPATDLQVQGPMNKVPIETTIKCGGNKYVLVAGVVLAPRSTDAGMASRSFDYEYEDGYEYEYGYQYNEAFAPASDEAYAPVSDEAYAPVSDEEETEYRPEEYGFEPSFHTGWNYTYEASNNLAVGALVGIIVGAFIFASLLGYVFFRCCCKAGENNIMNAEAGLDLAENGQCCWAAQGSSNRTEYSIAIKTYDKNGTLDAKKYVEGRAGGREGEWQNCDIAKWVEEKITQTFPNEYEWISYNDEYNKLGGQRNARLLWSNHMHAKGVLLYIPVSLNLSNGFPGL